METNAFNPKNPKHPIRPVQKPDGNFETLIICKTRYLLHDKQVKRGITNYQPKKLHKFEFFKKGKK